MTSRHTTVLRRTRYAPCVGTSFAHEAVRIRDLAGITDRQIARATGAAPSTVRDWFSGRTSPTGMRAERVAELGEVVDRIARVMDASFIPVWLLRPIEALGDSRPLDLIAKGQAGAVARVASELEAPGAV